MDEIRVPRDEYDRMKAELDAAEKSLLDALQREDRPASAESAADRDPIGVGADRRVNVTGRFVVVDNEAGQPGTHQANDGQDAGPQDGGTRG